MEDVFFLSALKFLKFRPRSEHEVVAYLTKKHAPEEVIPRILTKLREKKFLNDLSFASWWIEQRLLLKPKSRIFLTQELLQKGVAKETIINAFALISDQPTDQDIAKTLLQRKKTQYNRFSPEDRFKKSASFLSRKGFSYEVIRKSIDEVFST